LGPEGGRPGRRTQGVGHTCSGNLGIVKILRYIRSDMYTAKIHRKKTFWQEDAPLANGAFVLKHNGKSGTGCNPPYFLACPKQEPGAPTSCVVVFLCSVSYDARDLFVLLLLVILITITVSFHNITRNSRICSTLYHIAFDLPSCFYMY
jgi:hypothetical protein